MFGTIATAPAVGADDAAFLEGGAAMASDDIRAIINKYLPESVRLREPSKISRPKVRAPLAQPRTTAHPDASAYIPVHPADQAVRSKTHCPSALSPRQLAAAPGLATGRRVCA